jgi:hypothetical protein
MNPKSKRPKLKTAFKRFQQLPSLLPEHDARQPVDESKDQVQKLPDVVALPRPAAGASGLRTLAE